ncbi:flavin-containing monooxygenase [Mycobacterium vicinigordonae]|uniref:flavin-containing monooxygenase n=1 Tax=Mycobacterium vicinigordonae TaxID=1719132 RepID=UPI001FE8A3A4|nr:NAD(P)/FAD-dependent oxidoreductase [Mycobacterium vicinigordonae]
MGISLGTNQTECDLDVAVIGAGFAGLYAVHRARDREGLRVLAFDTASDVGGTWYWNRYPGCRCDIESIHYSYSFSNELQQEWKWSERYAAQPEILAYLNYVADKFDLRRNIQFNTRVESIVWDDDNSFWKLTTNDAVTRTARFIISGGGNVSVPKDPEFSGLETFAGEVYYTHRWPHEGVDLAGKRVGVIGTGASGIQIIPAIADQVSRLTVFQRTPNYATPLRNSPSDPVEQAEVLSRYPAIRVAARNHFMGITAEPADPSAKEADPVERRRKFDRLYEQGGFHFLMSGYSDVLFDEESNEITAQYVRDKIAERVTDPKVAELLSPRDHPYGTKRPPMETNYYETFNRDNVTLVDVKTHPITQVTPSGVVTDNETYELDVLIIAMGFDAFTGALLKMGIVGRNGQPLTEKWASGPRTYLGIASEGFPNFFMITGPQSAVALYNNPLAIEDHVEFATDAIKYALDNGISEIEPTRDAEDEWVELVETMAAESLFPRANSWYMGANIPGKPRTPMLYLGGAPEYRKICAKIVDDGYDGFTLTRRRDKATL